MLGTLVLATGADDCLLPQHCLTLDCCSLLLRLLKPICRQLSLREKKNGYLLLLLPVTGVSAQLVLVQFGTQLR